MVLKCDERGFELLLTVNHYKYVLKFCNINHSRGQNKADKLAPIPCLPVRPSHPGGHKEALGVNSLDCNIEILGVL